MTWYKYPLIVGEDGIRYEPNYQRPTLGGWLLALSGMTTVRRRRNREDGSIAAAVLEGKRSGQAPAVSYTRRALLSLALLLIVMYLFQSIFCPNTVWKTREEHSLIPEWVTPGSHPSTDVTKDVLPIACHSHNDYLQRIPLFEALHYGCTSVEADIWLNRCGKDQTGQELDLLVGHTKHSLSKERTLKRLYLDPLMDLLEQKNSGASNTDSRSRGLFDEDPTLPLVLLIDFKTPGLATFHSLWTQLAPLRDKDYLTYFDGREIHNRAITVVATGSVSFKDIVSNKTHRDIFFDAPLNRLSELWVDPKAPTPPSGSSLVTQNPALRENQTPSPEYSPFNSYYASASLPKTIGRFWFNIITSKQRLKIRSVLREAHKRGLKVRWWDTPSWPVSRRNHVWNILLEEGADVLNVDDLQAAATEDWKRHMSSFWI